MSIKGVIINEEALSDNVSFGLHNRSKTGRGKVWYPSLIVDNTIRATIKQVSETAYQGGTFKLTMWRPNPGKQVTKRVYTYGQGYTPKQVPAPSTYLTCVFPTQAEAVEFMRFVGPEFFRDG